MNNNFAFSYSGGKDSILALYTLIKEGYIPKVLFTVNQQFSQGKNSHALSKDILNRVSNSLNIPIEYLDIKENSIYQEEYPKFLKYLKEKYDLQYCGFGDIFLESSKYVREYECRKVDLIPLLPLFSKNEEDIINDLINKGFKGFIKSLDVSKLSKELLGTQLNEDLIDTLSNIGISLCGEYGEYHTFIYDGPIFLYPVDFKIGPIEKKDQYYTINII